MIYRDFSIYFFPYVSLLLILEKEQVKLQKDD